MVLRTEKFSEGYSDAYAGSGESAALSLIHAIHEAPRRSIILLDEPETSLHPSAQQYVLEFMTHMALHKDLQFVVATHSQYFGDVLPIGAVRLLREHASGSIELASGLTAKEALHDVAVLPRERTLLVEDERAQAIIVAALSKDPGNLEKEYTVRVRRGGASAILQDVAAHGSADSKHILIVLDGDQRPTIEIPIPNALPRGIGPLSKLISALTKGNDKNAPQISFATEADCIAYISFLRDNVYYLPGTTPESVVWTHENVLAVMNAFVDEQTVDDIEKIADCKERLRGLATVVPGLSEDAIFEMLLAKRLHADPDFVAALVQWIRNHLGVTK